MLREECANLRLKLASKQSMEEGFESVQDRLEDSKALCTGLESKINGLHHEMLDREETIEVKDNEIQELEYKMNIYVRQNDKERAENDEARTYLAEENMKARQAVKRAELELRDSNVRMKTMELKFRTEGSHPSSDLTRARARISNLEQQLLDAQAKMNKLKRRQSRTFASPLPAAYHAASPLQARATSAAPPWALHDGNAGSRGPSYKTDAERAAELRQRNAKNQRHLRTSYALETQENSAKFWDTLSKSAYVSSPVFHTASPASNAAAPAVIESIAEENSSLASTCVIATPATNQHPVVAAKTPEVQKTPTARVSPGIKSARAGPSRTPSPLARSAVSASKLDANVAQRPGRASQPVVNVQELSPLSSIEHAFCTPMRHVNGLTRTANDVPRMAAMTDSAESSRASSRASSRSSSQSPSFEATTNISSSSQSPFLEATTNIIRSADPAPAAPKATTFAIPTQDVARPATPKAAAFDVSVVKQPVQNEVAAGTKSRNSKSANGMSLRLAARIAEQEKKKQAKLDKLRNEQELLLKQEAEAAKSAKAKKKKGAKSKGTASKYTVGGRAVKSTAPASKKSPKKALSPPRRTGSRERATGIAKRGPARTTKISAKKSAKKSAVPGPSKIPKKDSAPSSAPSISVSEAPQDNKTPQVLHCRAKKVLPTPPSAENKRPAASNFKLSPKMTFALPAGEENAIPYSPELNKTTKGQWPFLQCPAPFCVKRGYESSLTGTAAVACFHTT